MNHHLPLVIALFLTGTACATTWAPSEKTDPLTGEAVPAHDIMSYGTYVYDWPSKFDIVFWPLTDENWICFNAKNGYAAFNSDFEELSDEEKESLTAWLAGNYTPEEAPETHEAKLAWLEKVYGRRQMDDDFWSTFYRLMAYIHQHDEATSLAYVKKTLPLLEDALKSGPEGIARIEILYLLGEYHRRVGELEKAREFFAQVKTAQYIDEEGKEQVGHPYFIRLIEDRQTLMDNTTSSGEPVSAGQPGP